MFKSLFGRITGADKKKQYPEQQAAFLGRVGDFFIVQPYGYFCDLPNDTLLMQLGLKSAIGTTEKRPDDVETGEPMLFHPETNTRIILRNNGDIDLISQGDVNITCANLNVTGNTVFAGSVMANGKSIDDSHTHDGSPTAATGPKSPTGAVL